MSQSQHCIEVLRGQRTRTSQGVWTMARMGSEVSTPKTTGMYDKRHDHVRSQVAVFGAVGSALYLLFRQRLKEKGSSS